jgi:hypothetical protein
MEIKEYVKETPQQETVEVSRNSKGYVWSVKLIGIDLDRLQKLTDELNRRYPRV